MHCTRLLYRLAFCGCAGVLALSTAAVGDPFDINLDGPEVKRIADGALTLMAFTVLPGATTSSLSIQSAGRSDPGLAQTTLGGGFMVSREFPLYLEGTLGYSNYDPEFVATDGSSEQEVPVRWNSFSVTGGVGWSFPITDSGDLMLRPIFNLTLGHVATDAVVLQDLVSAGLDLDINLVDGGEMDAYGIGGALMLDYERYREDHELDVELRYTNIGLHTFGSTTEGLRGESRSEQASIWMRYREPTGLMFLERPVRYVLEASHNQFFGPQRGALGFDYLSSVGAGLEIETSAYPLIVGRTRIIGRYVFGGNVSGYSLGLSVSF